MNEILRLENLSLILESQSSQMDQGRSARIINDLSWSVNKGECLAIVGESGCGKSASLQSILGLQGENATRSGKIFFKNDALHNYSDREMQGVRGKQIAMIFQDPMSALNPTMTIGDQLTESLPLSQRKDRAVKNKRLLALLTETGISDPELRLKQYPFELSGGMLQRVAIAMALAGEPSILMADEPTTSLDVTVQKQVLDLLKGIQARRSMTLILVSHDLSVVFEMADRVLVMYAGECVEEISKEALFSEASHPYTQALLASLPQVSIDDAKSRKASRLRVIAGQPPNLSEVREGCAFANRCASTMRVCVSQQPDLHEVSDNHRVRCWLFHPDKTDTQEGSHHANC